MRCVVLGMVVALAGLMASERGTAAEGGKSNPQLGKVRHVVLFKFKEGTTAEQQKTVEDAFRELPEKIHEIVGFEWGTNISPENLAPGIHPLLPGHVQRRQRPRRLSSPSGPQGVREAAEALSRQGAGDRLRGEGLTVSQSGTDRNGGSRPATSRAVGPPMRLGETLKALSRCQKSVSSDPRRR